MRFRDQLAQVINQIEPEHRTVVADSLRFSDGTPESFELELTSAVWDHPDLPVQDILHQLMVD
jgi:hypothetical protein